MLKKIHYDISYEDQGTCIKINGDRYNADHFGQTLDSFQTSGRLLTDFRQTSNRLRTSDSYLRTLDLGQTSNIKLQILDF